MLVELSTREQHLLLLCDTLFVMLYCNCICIEVRAYSRSYGKAGTLWKSASFMPYRKDATEKKGGEW